MKVRTREFSLLCTKVDFTYFFHGHLLTIKEKQYCIRRVGGVNCGFDGRKCRFTGDGYLRPSNPQMTPPTLQIQYCYSYSYEILQTCTH